MKRDSVSAYVHIKYETPSSCTQLYAFWVTAHHPQQLSTYLIDGPFFNQKTDKYIRISYSLKYKHSEK